MRARGVVLAWSAALQAVLIHVCTELRKLVAEQTHFASVAWQPVAPMALRAQVTCVDISARLFASIASWTYSTGWELRQVLRGHKGKEGRDADGSESQGAHFGWLKSRLERAKIDLL